MAASLTATALETAPGCDKLRELSASALVGMRKYDEAYAAITSLMRKDPSNVDYMLIRGKALYYKGDTAAAQTHFTQVRICDGEQVENGA